MSQATVMMLACDWVYFLQICRELYENFPDSSILVFNFREGTKQSSFARWIAHFDFTVLDYPRHYEGCPVLPLDLVQHYLQVNLSCPDLNMRATAANMR